MPRRDRWLLVALCCLAVSAGCLSVSVGSDTDAATTATPQSGTTVRVTDVVDGDTVDVRFPDGRADTVRLLGVDTPEVHVENDPAEFEGIPDTEAGRSCLRRYGERASGFAVERLADRRVTLRFDAAAGRRGGYDRLLAYVVVDDRSFNAALLERGYARLYDSSFRERDRYATLEHEARETGRGVWSCAS
ncbi:thermonuclease family protein [Haloplanus aerogenes]|uniref:Nuclease n=1 Tax=Haloplanus aerogenes TaxID=660522 RepID=A0A3M0DX01_9EURY|nr:thermonuclease family protein [Haloplanus aerogenes]AZH25676.1 nuclease [Haloplanus aerogenes]RMB25407.1 micrococcal nuclease [Haloplanus aerogenes]